MKKKPNPTAASNASTTPLVTRAAAGLARDDRDPTDDEDEPGELGLRTGSHRAQIPGQDDDR